jgi:hypothetical protein
LDHAKIHRAPQRRHRFNVVGIASFMRGHQTLGYGLVVAGLAVLVTVVIVHAKKSGKNQRDEK